MQPASPQGDGRKHRQASDTKSTGHASDATTDVDRNTTPPWRALFFFTTKSNFPLLVAGIVFSTIAGAVSPAQSFIIGKIFQGFTSYAGGQITNDKFFSEEKNYIFYLLIISGGSCFFHFLELAAWLAFGELQAKSARDRLFYGLLEKDMEWYDMRKNGIGALLPRLQTQIRDLQLATSQPLGTLFSIVSTVVISLVQAFVRSWDLTLVTLATVPLIMAAVVWIGNGMQRNLVKNQRKLAEAQKYSTSALSAIETVKCFNAQEIEQQKYTKSITEAATSYYRVANANALQTGLIVLLSVSMFVQGFYYGSVLIAEGKRSTDDVIATFLSAIASFQALNGILPQLIVLEKGRTASATLRAIMAQVQQKSHARITQGWLKPAKCHGDIEVRNLTFAYPSRPLQPALKDVSLVIPGGHLTFLIGKSGSGKSTLGQLLMQFYSPLEGHISLDGVSLESFDANWLRSNVTLVEQTSILFDDTVFNNIAFGRKYHDEVTTQQVMGAAEFALLRLMIDDLPDGLNTVIGYRGGTMSGGQRQRMALARARLRDTPILVLDESTSALDHISRSLMMDAIRLWRRGRTTIIITHDITQILPEDYVYVLQHGSLVQEGYRKHLEMAKDAAFQGFLSEDQKAIATATKSHGHTKNSSLDHTAGWRNSMISDPLEAQLDASENKRLSFLPRAFKEGAPLPAMRARKYTHSPSSVGSSWAKSSRSPSPSPTTLGSFRLSGWFDTKDSEAFRLSREEKRDSDYAMEDHMDKTGKSAAESRIATTRVKRRQIRSSTKMFNADDKQASIVCEENSRTSDPVYPNSFKHIMSTLWPSIDSHTRIVVIIGFWGATIHAIGSPVFSVVLSKLILLYSVPGGNGHKSLVYSMAILGIAIVDAAHTYIFRSLLEYAGQRWVDSIRSEAMTRILDQPRAFFDKEENAVSRLCGCLDRNAEEMRNLLGRFLALIWVAALMCAVSVIWAIVVQWKMTIISLSAAPYIVGVTKAFAAVSEKWEGLSNIAADDAAAIFTETFTNIKTVRALTLEQHFINKYIKSTNYVLNIGFRRAFFSGFFYGLSDSAGNFSIAMVFYVGAKLVQSGTHVEAVVQVFTILIMAITNVEAILDFIPQIVSSKDTASHLLRLAQLPMDSHEHLGDTQIRVVGDITFKDLEFSYPSQPDQTILKHVNLHIQAGSCTAIVGGSGSGKSTIANLLLNLYPVPKHTLTLSGRSMPTISTSSLRALVVPVSQTPTLFSATIAENIAYGLSSSTPLLEIETAAQKAGIHSFITSLPQGYDTFIGGSGVGLSGGQAQRITIARALIHSPDVLILDEATSALDVESASVVRDTICRLIQECRGTTVLIITHSREMMEVAERIVVLDQGRVVEEGGFDELLGRKGALGNLLDGGEWREGVA